jgi:hypothetical protein
MLIPDDNVLFNSIALSDFTERQKASVRASVENIREEEVLTGDVDAYARHISEKLPLDVPTLRDADEDISTSTRETSREVQGYGRVAVVRQSILDVSAPFDGPAEPFRIQPSRFTGNPPYGVISAYRT